ncbi:cell division control protein Cdc6 [Candidatus Woesearchaeota archaeon CG10_big_fil_rev_8_21_14_0_10_45_16]|nr:MAG: cell division control protein Cdc6 [Candidatus Woesearchaeota archaeon CG10_big_fil_rev_8_21_14_0_10_45_16]
MGISNFFENYLKKDSFFVDKSVLLSSYMPEEVIFRENLIQEAANILAPALREEKPSNLFVYGKTGTGKTLSVKYLLRTMKEIAEKNNINIVSIYINCKLKRVADTEYRLIARLIKEFGEEVPATGLPTDEVYNIFYTLLDKKKQVVLLVLDEIDQLTKKIGDEILYNLTRINAELKNSQICLIGISNSLIFSENLDPRVRSSLSEEELIFPPYNALQIQDILRKRGTIAFKEGAVEAGLIEKCAAYAAREHGDVRRAIDLLRVAGELAERAGSQTIPITYLDEAERKVESDRIINATISQPKQFQSVLYALLYVSPQKKNFFTGEIYEVYQGVCRKCRLNVLTQRRVSDILAELDMLGIINAKIISKGRYGRTREISLSLEEGLERRLREVLEKSLGLA